MVKNWATGLDQHAVQEVENLCKLPFCIQAHSPDARRPRRKRDADRRSAGNEGRSRSQRRGSRHRLRNVCGKDQCKSRRHNPGSAPQKILRGIRKQIPLGRAHHKIAQPEEFMPQGHNLEATVVVARQQMSAMKQIGTLGGGNHFIELQRDEGGQPMDNDPLGLAQSRQTGGRLLQREGRGTEPSMVLIGSLRNTIAVSAHAHRRVPPILGRDELLHRLRSRQPPTDDAAHPGSDRRSYARHRI